MSAFRSMLLAQAAAIRAEAEARATSLEAIADAALPGADGWLSMAEAGERAGKTARATRDGLARDGVELGGAGRSPRVRASVLDRWIASRRRAAPMAAKAETPREAGRRAAAAAAARISGGSQ